MSEPTPGSLIERVRADGESFAAFIETLDEARFCRRPGVDEWSAAELAGHVCEFPLTFARQAVELAAHPGMDVHRHPDDPGRLAALERLQGAGPVDAAGRVRAAIAEAVGLLAAIPEDAWANEGVRVVNGEAMPLHRVVSMLIVGHVGMHLDQAKAAAGA